MGAEEEEKGKPIFKVKDIRRYRCPYCDVIRSKKSLISSHILAHHPEKNVEQGKEDEEEGASPPPPPPPNKCEECGATFKKPAHLKQHIQSRHSDDRPFVCTVDGCGERYKRKDHLNRHLLTHQGEGGGKGKLFKCPIENCNREFAFQGNLKRHVKEFHEDEDEDGGGPEQHVCQECGKVFKFASKLRKHEESHVKLDSVEAFCGDCKKHFTNDQCLRAHVQACHRYTNCEICGKKQLIKNILRHLRSHESGVESEKIKCDFEDCDHTFSNKSNLRQHVKAMHEGLKPFACCYSGCGQRFSYKHVRDNHEKSGHHTYHQGDFIETDEQFQSRPRGGRKRTCPTVELLVRKRVTPFKMDTMMDLEPNLGCSEKI